MCGLLVRAAGCGWIILVCVKSPQEYRCLVLPLTIAERAAQLNLEHSFRLPRANQAKKKPGKMWVSPDYPAVSRNPNKIPLIGQEIALVLPYKNAWHLLDEGGEDNYADHIMPVSMLGNIQIC